MQTTITIVHAAENMKQLAIALKQALWSTSVAEEDRVLAAATSPFVRKE